MEIRTGGLILVLFVITGAFPCGVSAWDIEVIDSDKTYFGTSIAINSSNIPAIAYDCDTTGPMGVYVNYSTWTGGAWQTAMVDTLVAAPPEPSLIFDGNDIPWMSFQKSAGMGTYILYSATQPDDTWIEKAVGPTLVPGYSVSPHQMAVDNEGIPHVAYAGNGDNTLKYAKYNATSSAWQNETVDTGVGLGISIAIDCNNRPHIAYTDTTSGTGTVLRHAYYNGTAWVISEAYTGSIDRYCSIDTDAAGDPHIAFVKGDKLAVADGNLDSEGVTWTIRTHADTAYYLSLDVDDEGHPRIAYHVPSSGPVEGELCYTWYDGASWTSEVVDSEGDTGKACSLKIDPTGRVHISYMRDTSSGLSRGILYASGTMDPAPIANFTANKTFGPAPLTVQFTDTSTNLPTSWNWSFGDGYFSEIQDPVHTYTSPGKYTVSLYATNAGGSNCSAQPDYIHVNSPPVVNNLVLSSTSGQHYVTDNLTATWDLLDADDDPVWNITEWYQNGTSIHALNMPFEAGSNSTFTRDYSGNGHHGSVNGATWTAGSGHGGSGAYLFDGIDDHIDVGTFNPTDTTHLTLAAWVNVQMGGSASKYILTKGNDNNQNSYGIFIYGTSDASLCAAFMTWGGGDGNSVRWAASPAGSVSANTWHHIAGVIDGQTMYLYLDGELVDTETIAGTMYPSAQSVWIGGQNRGGFYYRFKGLIDNAALYDRPLSAEQVRALYQNRTDRIVSEELGPGDTWQVSVTPNDGYQDGNTVFSNTLTLSTIVPPATSFIANKTFGPAPLTVQFTDTSDNSPTSWNWSFGDGYFSEIQNPVHTYTSPGKFTVSLDAANPSGSNLTVRHDFINVNSPPVVNNLVLSSTSGQHYVTDNLTATWDLLDADDDPVWNITEWYQNGTSIHALNMPFEAGSNSTFTRDYSGNGHHGSVNGATWTAGSGHGGSGAYLFDGIDDHIDAGTFNPTDTTHLTLAAWVKVHPEGSSSKFILTKGHDDSQNSYGILVFGTTNESLSAGFMTWGGGDGNYVQWASSPAGFMSFHTWHHIAGVIDGQTMYLYLNGELVDTKTINGDMYPSAQSVWIGGQNRGGYPYRFKGFIDDAALYDRSLSAEQVRALYQNRTDRIVSQELGTGDTWQVSVTPNDGYQDGNTVFSNTLTIEGVTIPPVASFAVNATSGTAPHTVQFTDTSTNTPTTWNWSFGDGTWFNTTVEEERNPTYTYTSPGIYTGKLRVSNDAGSDTTDPGTVITVTGLAPVASFAVNATSGTAPHAVQFTDTSTNTPTTWNWSFGDGMWFNTTVEEERNPTYTYTSPGIYTARLRVSNDAGSDTTDPGTVITVTGLASVASFAVNATSGTAPHAVQFTDTSTNTPTTWNWSFGDGMWFNTTVVAERNPTYTYTSPGIYTARLRVSNEEGSDTTDPGTVITVTGLAPVASFAVNATSGTAPHAVQFTDTSTNTPTTWNWSFGDGTWFNTTVEEERNPTYTYTSPSIYTVKLRVSNDAGSDTTDPGTVITVTGLASVASFYANQTSGFVPLHVRFTDTSTNTPTTWNWSFGDGMWFNTTDPSLRNTTKMYGMPAEPYTVGLTVSNAWGSDTLIRPDYIQVPMLVPPMASFTAVPVSGTTPLTVRFNDTSTGLFLNSWNWSYGDGTWFNTTVVAERNTTHTYTTPGIYTVRLKVANSGGWDTTNPGTEITVTDGAPTVQSITPNTGINTGTVNITNLSGTGYLDGATVILMRAGEPNLTATGVGTLYSTRITCIFDLTGTETGQWDVVVSNPDGQSGILPNGFTIILPAPTVTSISPVKGERGTTVQITAIRGTGFIPGTKVTLIRTGKSIAMGDATAVNPTTITGNLTIPKKAEAGKWTVLVENPNGQSATLPKGFTVTLPPPTVNSIRPATAKQGTTVQIKALKGTGFVSGTRVKLIRPGESIAMRDVNVVKPTKITGKFVIPANAETQRWNVLVKNPDGQKGKLVKGFRVKA